MSLLSWLGVIVGILSVYIIYMCWHYLLFYKQGIPMNSTPVPVFGTLLKMIRDGPIEMYNGTLNKLGLTWGDFVGRVPVLTTCDTDIIRSVYIKEIMSFPARISTKTGDDVSDSMIASVTDYEHWKHLRSVMSPAFSSGKLKRMISQINRCAEQYRSHLIKQAEGSKSVEMNRLAGSYTMDVIASTAFGLDINTEDDVDNEFVKHAKKAFEFNIRSPKRITMFLFPFLAKFLKITIINRDVVTFFTQVIRETIRSRKEDDEGRVDFMQLMLNAHKEQPDPVLPEEDFKLEKPKRGISEVEMLAQGLIFFLAGYDTTAAAISFLAHNLACNPDKQDKLIEEVDSVIRHQDQVSDQDLQNMPYLDMCVNESLRLYPSVSRVERCASKDVDVKGIKLPKNAQVRVPIYHMHRHEAFYPNPDAFIPERFSAEEKAARDPLLFMPFGAGPRQCIAARFALTEVKVATCHILKTHRFVKAPETETPVKLVKSGLLKAENGIWLRLEQRENI